MILREQIHWGLALRLSMPNILYSLFVAALAYFLHVWLDNMISWVIPLALIGTLGTALAILLGFRNSAAYDRWWEARKIWGGIVNDSRTWGRQALTLVSLHFANQGASKEDLKKIQKTLIYRHIAWINALRLQLRGQMETADWEAAVEPFLDQEEYRWLSGKRNRATQLIRKQGKALQESFENGFIDNFRHIQMDNTLTSFYTLQGKAERIKSTPMVKPYHTWSRLFLNIFIFFLPFALIEVFSQSNAEWLVFPVTIIMSWVFFVIYMFGEILGEPFENGQNDTPLTAICNTIEIDLKDMLDEPELPEKLKPVDGVLM